MSTGKKDFDFLQESETVEGQKTCLMSFLPPKEAHGIEFQLPITEAITEAFEAVAGEMMKEVKEHIDHEDQLAVVLKKYVVEVGAEVARKREDRYEQAIGKGIWGAVKVIGVFDDDAKSAEQAKEFAKEHQQREKNFDIFMGPTGKWLPFNPPSSMMENSEYAEKGMNDLMKGFLQAKLEADKLEKQRQADLKEHAMKAALEESLGGGGGKAAE